MSNYKILDFLKISLFFTLILSSSLAWSFNNMCHSPIQLAALMSPNKVQPNKKNQLKKRISALEKKIEEYENKMDDVEGILGDSLSKDKLNADPHSVAGSIRSYIENSQSGWPCVERSNAGNLYQEDSLRLTFLKNLSEGYFQSHLLNVNVLDLLIPSAYAKTSSTGKIKSESDISPAPEFSENDKTDPCKNRASDGKCICDFGFGLESDRCVNCSEKDGGAWKFKTIREACVCDENDNVKVGSACREKTNKEKCMQEGKIWTGNNDNAPMNHCKSQNEINQEECEKQSGKEWKGGQCVCKRGYGKEDGNCVLCSGKPGGKWNFISTEERCACTGNDLKRDGNTCREKTNKEKCMQEGKIWTGNNDNAPMNHCKSQNEINQEECEKQSGKEWKGGQCVCKRGYGKEDGNCVLCSGKPGGKWNFISTEERCACNETSNTIKDSDGKCRERNQEEKCSLKGANWILKGGDCICPAPIYKQ